jgi:hypothetical protein
MFITLQYIIYWLYDHLFKLVGIHCKHCSFAVCLDTTPMNDEEVVAYILDHRCCVNPDGQLEFLFLSRWWFIYHSTYVTFDLPKQPTAHSGPQT